MTAKEKLIDLKTRMEKIVRTNILPFWTTCMEDREYGGFYGAVDGDLKPVLKSLKAVVLNTRMLWTFSTAYKLFGDEIYKTCAKRAFDYIKNYFWDEKYGGVYWNVNYKGDMLESQKRTYGQAFIIYSMAQYFNVFGEKDALDMAIKTFYLVQENVKYVNGGYADSVHRDWMKDPLIWKWSMNSLGAAKLLNSHLHLFEATITLFEATEDAKVKEVLKEFIDFLIDTVVDRGLHHLKAGMDENNNRIDHEISYGHDSECCYLIVQAAHIIGDPEQINRAETTALDIMEHVYQEGIDPVNGGIFYEHDYVTRHTDKTKVWWAQAEAITSFFNCYQITKDEKYLDAAINVWNYVEKNVVDYEKGEWFENGKAAGDDVGAHRRDLARYGHDQKANRYKCPYHNSRTCFEIMSRVDAVLGEV